MLARVQGEFRPRCQPAVGLVRPVPVDPTGRRGPTRGQAQKSRWRQTTHGFHVPSCVSEEVPEQRILEQSMRLPAGGAVTGWAACRLALAAYFDGLERDGATRQPVPLLVPQGSKLRSLPGSVLSREPVTPAELTRMQQVPATVPVRALFDEMRRVADPREAVVALDMTAAAELVSIRELRAFHAARTRWRRSRRVAWALDLASERSLSPGETRMRLIWVLDAGLPVPLVNQPVWDRRGRLLGVADVFDPSSGVVGEYDGATHRRARRHASDVEREDRFRRAGLEYVKVTGVDVHDRHLVAERILTTRRRALLLNGRAGSWTLDPPEGWWSTDTAEERLARRDYLRSRGIPA